MAIVLLTGGIRSGKSRLAAQRAARSGKDVTLIATAEPGDEEMAARIERHRLERSSSWDVVEEPIDLGPALGEISDDRTVVIDCLTMWVSNQIGAGLSDDDIVEECSAAVKIAGARRTEVVVVTNEVGSGIVPDNALARRFEEVLGRVNAEWSRAAVEALLVVAGRAVRLPPVEQA